MGAKIKGAEYSLAKIFSSDFDYEIPSYQRPYAWTTEEAGILFDDLYDFFKEENDDTYFLCSVNSYKLNKCTALWWLRSPGEYSVFAARVLQVGYVDTITVSHDYAGVRPALWLNI